MARDDRWFWLVLVWLLWGNTGRKESGVSLSVTKTSPLAPGEKGTASAADDEPVSRPD